MYIVAIYVCISHFPFGTVIWQALALRPFTNTVQVPQSPLLQLYGIFTRAAAATTLIFWPTTAFCEEVRRLDKTT